ncbi:UPF0061 domain-containing protein [Campylobacter blaseri]|uniref:Protein nucleotidyltransferase YdiU n=1 Tax=Campylobacter blaseri TaxID=2042961 RepID=A0A2P8R0D3_9BACT|nr:YdiU family protein [Campylobacter blaseri]PSM51950.1 hypothetical protein CQ405_05135 [Campylobacter blaseri]PSM53734.1 hypothetical protein CRN67_05135 [Campylobacter blaseri]QKF85710.1 UPF0061 domain-containing protein [Campylobacter blaseri]
MNLSEKSGWSIVNTYEKLPKKFYSKVKNANFLNPKLILYNESLAKTLGIDEEIEKLSEDEKAEIFVGNKPIKHTKPIAQAYAGHQFGHFTILGDGRAMLIAEQQALDGKIYDLHLKGSGTTPYSRGGDGKAVIKPMLREYLISEAMHYLGISTTRSLAVSLTGEEIYRNGMEQGAVLARVASSHLRVGTFEFASLNEKEDLKKLANYAIKRHYGEILTQNEENIYTKLLQNVIEKQANLIAKWQLVGFIHGVMNTDNMTISGESIDYGPCAFMNEYDVNTVFSSIDRNGRYAYGNQPSIGQWNLSKFADTLLPLIHKDEDMAVKIATKALSKYSLKFNKAFISGMKAKIGLLNNEDDYLELIQNLLTMMQEMGADYTNTFVRLTLKMGGKDGSYLQGTKELFDSSKFKIWQKKWLENINSSKIDKKQIFENMKKANPFIIPRNNIVEDVLKKASSGNFEEFNNFLNALKNPYEYKDKNKNYQELPPKTMQKYQTFCGT